MTQRYLIRNKKPKKRDLIAHFWTGRDTVCGMATTGGLNPKKYHVTEDLGGLAICRMCESVANNGQVKKKFDKWQKHAFAEVKTSW